MGASKVSILYIYIDYWIKKKNLKQKLITDSTILNKWKSFNEIVDKRLTCLKLLS